MLRRKVTGPDGRVWKLGRRWMPRRRRIGRVDVPDLGVPDFGLDDLGAVIGAIVLAIAVVLLALVLFNVVAIAIELMIVIVLFLAGVVGRVVFRRPWTVFAQTKNVSYHRNVVGWRASRRAIDDMAGR